jgi:methylated-DNA-[protein]-cysteine S-methyltransferase
LTVSTSPVSFIYHSPLGKLRLIEKQGFLKQADFVEELPEEEISSKKPQQPISSFLRKVCLQLDEYFSGNLQHFELPLNPQGTPFQRSAWKALLRIPYGETRSYLQQAQAIENPKAVRAIGNANSKNPISIIIPCHRVIGKNGTLTGYAGGIERKNKLLELERCFKPVQKN